MDPITVTIDDVTYIVSEEGLTDEEGNIIFEYSEYGDVVDAEGNVIIEAHDLKDAEVQAVQANDKAEDATKKAPARKGDKSNSEKPTTLAGKAAAMYDKMKGLSKEELDVAYDMIMGDNLSEESVEESVEDIVDSLDLDLDFTDDLDALVESEATLSDDFKAKTAVIFEAAIKSKVASEVDRLETEYENNLAAAIEESTSDIVEKVDSYLNYVVDTWMEENELAIEQGLRTEIAENFMDNMKDLFVESYIEIPESKVDLVDELADQVEELEGQLDKTLSDAISMAEELETYQRATIVREQSSDLAETQTEKLLSLVDELDFEDVESFAEKVKTVKESYFKKTTTVDGVEVAIDEETDEKDDVVLEGPMANYVKAVQNLEKNK